MQTRRLGKTDLQLPILSFGASSLGAEFRSVTLDEAVQSVRVALDCGLNFIDTSPFYGRGMSEVLLGVALKGVPRASYTLCTKLGRYDLAHFDFSARRVAESVDVSLHRLGCGHLDIVLCHDIEFVRMQQIVDETLPALRKAQQAGKVRYLGFSGYPQKIFKFICDQADVDCVLSYNQYTLQNTRFADETLPYLKAKGIGAMNAGPFSARLLTNAPLPAWLKEPEAVKEAARRAAAHCAHCRMFAGFALPAIVVAMSGCARLNCSASLAMSTPFCAQCAAAARAAAFTFSGSFSHAGSDAFVSRRALNGPAFIAPMPRALSHGTVSSAKRVFCNVYWL